MVVVFNTFSLIQNKNVACINHLCITCHMIRFICFCFGRGNVPRNLFWALQKRLGLFQFSFSLSIQKAVLCFISCFLLLPKLFDQLFACFSVFLFTYVFLSFQNKPRYCCQGNRLINCFWVLQKLHHEHLFSQFPVIRFSCFPVFDFRFHNFQSSGLLVSQSSGNPNSCFGCYRSYKKYSSDIQNSCFGCFVCYKSIVLSFPNYILTELQLGQKRVFLTELQLHPN